MKIFRYPLFLISAVLFYSAQLAAQGVEIKGSIKDAKSDDPLIGANILFGETGVATDFDGRFRILLDPGIYTIQVSYVGYDLYSRDLEVKADAPQSIQIHMNPISTVLNTATVTTGKYQKPLGEVTVSLEVLKPDLIENTNKTTLDQAIEKIPGVRVIDGQANIRGGSGFSQGAGSRVLLLLNDVPMLQPDAGYPNWSDIPIEIADQLEVVKGAASSLYGSSAMNGIINVRTTYAGLEPETKANIFYTGYMTPSDPDQKWWNSARYTTGGGITHKQRFGKLDLVAGAYYLNEESFQKESFLKYGRFSFSTRYRITDRLVVGLNGNVNKGARNSFFYWKGIDSLFVGSNNTFSLNDRFRLNVDPYVNYFDKAGNRHRFIARYYYVDNNITNNRSNESNNYYGEYQFLRQFNSIDLVLTAGLVGSFFRVQPSPLYGNGVYTSRNLAGYVQVDKKFFDRLNVSAGFRYEDNYLNSPGQVCREVPIPPSEEKEAKPVLRLGLNLQALEYTYIRASFGQGYRFPTIAEKYIFTDVGGFTIEPNPDLMSETGWSAEIGIKQGFKVFSFEGFLDVSGFINKYEDMMEFNLIRSECTDLPFTVFQSTNIGGTTIKGYEVTLAGRGSFLNLPTSILAGYTFIDPTFDEWDPDWEGFPETQGELNAYNSSSDVNILKYRSQHMFKLDIQTEWNNFSFGLETFYASNMEAIDNAFNAIVPGLKAFREKHDKGYNIYNFRVAYKMGEHYKISLILNNAFNLEYAVRPGLMDAPRNLTARVDFKF